MLTEGDSGPLSDRKAPDAALLFERTVGDSPEMPESQPALSTAEPDVLRRCLKAGPRPEKPPQCVKKSTGNLSAGCDSRSEQGRLQQQPHVNVAVSHRFLFAIFPPTATDRLEAPVPLRLLDSAPTAPGLRVLILLSTLLSQSSIQAASVLESVFPLSCRSGEHATVTLSGQQLDGVYALVFSIPEVSAKHIEANTFRISVAADTPPQDCDVWCLMAGRISNPRRFVVSGIPTAAETEDNDSREKAQTVAFPGAVDGRFETEARVDWFKFEVQAESHLTLRCRSRSLDAAVIPVLTVFDASGREIAHSSGRQREPLLHCRLSGRGTHHIRVSERAYRKSAENYYRLELRSGPGIAAVWPDLIGQPPHSELTFYGYELDASAAPEFRRAGGRSMLGRLTESMDWKSISLTEAWTPAGSPFRVAIPPVLSGKTQNVAGLPRLHFTDQAVLVEDEDHTEAPDMTQLLPVPVTLNGRFNTRNDSDWYSFKAIQGQQLQFDLYGDRLGHQMDPDAIITDASGKTLFTFPDGPQNKNRPAALSRSSLDVSGSWKAAADGTYRIVVRDLYGSSISGVDRTYVLSVRIPQPTYRAFAVPPEKQLPGDHMIPRSGRTAIRVSLDRRDGFTESIRIGLSESSRAAGLRLDDCWIGPGVTSGLATLSIPEDFQPPESVHFLELITTPESSPDSSSRVPAVTRLSTDGTAGRMMSALPVSFSSAPPFQMQLTLQKPAVSAGGQLQLTIRQELRHGSLKQPVTIEFPGFPTALKSPATTISPTGTALELPVPKSLPPGLYSVTARVRGTVTAPPAGQKPDAEREQTHHVWTNAVSFRVEAAADDKPADPR